MQTTSSENAPQVPITTAPLHPLGQLSMLAGEATEAIVECHNQALLAMTHYDLKTAQRALAKILTAVGNGELPTKTEALLDLVLCATKVTKQAA